MRKYKEDDWIICIDSGRFNKITEGNIYRIVNLNRDLSEIYIIDDCKNRFGYFAYRFKFAPIYEIL